jgi:malate/lactate dehydrogenase
MSLSVPVYLSSQGVTGVEVLQLSPQEQSALEETAIKIAELSETITVEGTH